METGLLIAAIVLTAIGLWLLARHVVATSGSRLVLLGAAVYTAAGTLGLLHEATTLSTTLAAPLAPLWGLPAYVAGAYVGQAVIGLGLVRSGFAGVGWLVLAWNLAWLVILALASPGDVYYPALHHLLQPALIVPLRRDGDRAESRPSAPRV